MTLAHIMFATTLCVALAACGSSSSNNNGDAGETNTGDTNTGDTGNGDTGTGDNGSEQPTDNTPNTATLVDGSNNLLLDTATPSFQWNAVDNATEYRVTLTEPEGNRITHTASLSSCNGTECVAAPSAAFYNNSIDWRVDAIADGQVLQSAASGSYRTPLSLALTPETSNPAACDIWPSITYNNIIVLNNIWNARATSNGWTQLIGAQESTERGPIATWSYDWLDESDGDRTAVKAYPQVIYGNKLGTHVSGSKEETGLPETISALPEFRVDFDFSESFNGAVERNVALESFFHDSCDITGPCDTVDNRAYEMMIWVENPDENRPGDLALTGVMIDNRLWDVYIKPRSNKNYIAFTAQNEFSSGSLQWNRFVDWTVNWTAENAATENINQLTADLCMAAIEMGTELWWGEGSFTLNNFNVDF